MPAKTKPGRSAAAVKAAKTRRYKSAGRKAALTKKRAAPTPLSIVKKGYNYFGKGDVEGIISQELEFTQWENRQWVVDGKTVIVLGYYAGKNKRTGKPFKSEFAHVLTVERGKITSFKEFTDTAAVLEAAS